MAAMPVADRPFVFTKCAWGSETQIRSRSAAVVFARLIRLAKRPNVEPSMVMIDAQTVWGAIIRS